MLRAERRWCSEKMMLDTEVLEGVQLMGTTRFRV